MSGLIWVQAVWKGYQQATLVGRVKAKIISLNFFKQHHIIYVFLVVHIKRLEHFLPHDISSGSDITPCNKINKPQMVYRLSGNVMTSIIMCVK